MQLFPKPTGGNRTIGHFKAFFRVWQKQRKKVIREWETTTAMDNEFAASPSRSAVTTVWRQSVVGETASASGTVACSVLWDLRRCYEYLEYYQLFSEGEKHAYPESLLLISGDSYQWGRIIVADGCATPTLFARRGIIAGSSPATVELKLALLSRVRSHVLAHPKVEYRIWVDDITASSKDKSKASVVDNLVCGAADLVNTLVHELHLPVAKDKAMCIGNSKDISDTLQTRLGSLAGRAAAEVKTWA